MSSVTQARAGIKLGRYQVLGRIATGGMATVYRARLRATGGFERAFALKVIHPHLTRAEGFLEHSLPRDSQRIGEAALGAWRCLLHRLH